MRRAAALVLLLCAAWALPARAEPPTETVGERVGEEALDCGDDSAEGDALRNLIADLQEEEVRLQARERDLAQRESDADELEAEARRLLSTLR